MAYPRRRATTTVAITVMAAVLATCGAAPPTTLLAPASAAAAPSPAVAAPDPTSTGPGAAMDAYLSGLTGEYAFRGAVLVARGTDVLLAKGYGEADRSTGTPNTPHTLYRIGSITKQFTALAILKLQEQGKLEVTDPICQHINPCPAAWRPIAIEHLLLHTSGLREYFGLPDLPFSTTLSPRQLVGLFRDRLTQFAPGSYWWYSNSGYAVLGYLIERLTGLAYADFLRQEILDPLGLSETGYDVNRPTTTAHATGYTGPDDAPARFVDMSIPYAAGAMYSSVSDLYRWNRFLLTGTPSIVDPTTLAQMFSPHVRTGPLPDSPWYGYGWLVYDPVTDRTYGHGGNLYGFSAYNLIKPRDQLSITIMTNRDSVQWDDVAGHLATLATGVEGCRQAMCPAAVAGAGSPR